MTPEEHVDAINFLTGWDLTLEECFKISERVWNQNRCHYIERNGGPGRKFDIAPGRHLTEPIPDGPAEGKLVGAQNFEKMLDDYYYKRGWDRDGNPTREAAERKLAALEEAQRCLLFDCGMSAVTATIMAPTHPNIFPSLK